MPQPQKPPSPQTVSLEHVESSDSFAQQHSLPTFRPCDFTNFTSKAAGLQEALESLRAAHQSIKKRFKVSSQHDVESMPPGKRATMGADLFEILDRFWMEAPETVSFLKEIRSIMSSTGSEVAHTHMSRMNSGSVGSHPYASLHVPPGYGGPRGASPSALSRLGSVGSVTSLQSLLSIRPVRNTERVVVSKDDDGNKLINDYSIIGDLGKGAQAKVKLAVHINTDQVVAIKVIQKSMLKQHQFSAFGGMALERLRAEIAIMKKMRHKNVVQLHEVIDDPDANKMYLVMQYVEQGPFFRIARDNTCEKFPEEEIGGYLKQILSGTQYLHRHGIIHRDLKPDNILRGANGELFLADFGVSEMVEGDDVEVSGIIGTPLFFSPELCRREGKVHGKAVDVWAIGVILYAMLFGKLPFQGTTVEDICSQIQNCSVVVPDTCSPHWRDAVTRLLDKDPTKRMTLPELREHECLRGFSSPSKSSRTNSTVASENGSSQQSFEILQVNEDDVCNAVRWGSNINIEDHSSRTRYRVHRYVRHIRAKMEGKTLTVTPRRKSIKPKLPEFADLESTSSNTSFMSQASTQKPSSRQNSSMMGTNEGGLTTSAGSDSLSLHVHPPRASLSPHPPSNRGEHYTRDLRSLSPATALHDEPPEGKRRASNNTVATAREEDTTTSSLLEDDLMVFKKTDRTGPRHPMRSPNAQPILPKIPRKPGRRVQKLSMLAGGGITSSMSDLVHSNSEVSAHTKVANSSRMQQNVHSTLH